MKSLKTAGLLALGVLLCSTSAQGETLAEAIEEVIKTNPQVRSQVFNRLARDQQVAQAKAGYYPVLEVMAGAGMAEYWEPEDESLNPREVVISLRQNVFSGFATMNEVERQRARVDSSAYSLQRISENLALGAARAYVDVLRKEELKKIAEENLQTHLRIMDQIRLRGDSGVGSQADTSQVQGRLSLAQANVVVAESNLLDAYSNYQAVVGKLPENLVKPQPPEGLMPATLEEALDRAVAGHPTLKSAMADLNARKAQYEVAKSVYYPIVDLEIDQRWDEEVSRIEGEREQLVAMARVRYNLFNGFSDQARKAETLEQVNEAREIKNNTERQVVESMRLSWMAYQSVFDRIDYLRDHIKATSETAGAYSKQFDIGRRTLLDVLDTEAEAINARIDMVEAEADGMVAQYRILNGMGELVSAFDLSWPEEAMIADNK